MNSTHKIALDFLSLSAGLVRGRVLPVGPAGCGGDDQEPPVKLPTRAAQIAFSHDDEIRVLHADGSHDSLVDDAAHPAWSPDGRKIAFERINIPGVPVYEISADDIWVVNADGTGERRLTDHPEEDHEPAWSPDGQRIAFVSKRRAGNPDVYVMNADGSALTRLTDGSAFDRDPAWSPDGRWIAFSSGPADGFADIWVMSSDGTHRRQLTRSPGREDNEPAWSPDGTKIAFGSGGEIRLMNADGSDKQRLTRRTLEDDPLDGEPDWSPDGGGSSSSERSTPARSLRFG